MKITFTFRTFKKITIDELGYPKGEGIQNTDYTWEIPEEIKEETAAYFFAKDHEITEIKALEIMAKWDIKEKAVNYYEKTDKKLFEEYIKKNYEIAAYNQYKLELQVTKIKKLLKENGWTFKKGFHELKQYNNYGSYIMFETEQKYADKKAWFSIETNEMKFNRGVTKTPENLEFAKMIYNMFCDIDGSMKNILAAF